MITRFIIAGAGGQGAILLGKLLAQAALFAGKELTYFPCYGAEVRGGTANCHVILSDGEPIFSPTVEEADVLVIMNQPSYEKFSPRLKPDGVIFAEASLVHPNRDDQQIVNIPALETAIELGNQKTINMVMLGALNARQELVDEDSLVKAIGKFMTGRKADMLEVNLRALSRGYQAVGKTADIELPA